MAKTTTTPEQRKAGLNVPDDDPEATQTLVAIDTTQPLDKRDPGSAIVAARTDEATLVATDTHRGVKLARNATHQRNAAALLEETRRVGDLIALLIEVGDHHDDHQLAPAGLRKRVADAARAFTEGGESA